jgi:hypothetical protein
MALNLGWLDRLIATQSAIRTAVEEIERVAVRGLPSGGGTSPPLTPLPSEQWPALQDGLMEITEEMDALMRTLAPQEARTSHERQPLAATHYQLSVALLMLEEQVIDDIDPARVQGFGELLPSDREVLAVTASRLRTRVKALSEYVENLPNEESP